MLSVTLVSTGSTLLKMDWKKKTFCSNQQACIFANDQLSEAGTSYFGQVTDPLKSVLKAQNNNYLLMNAPNDQVEKIIQILPGMKSPTVMPLATSGWSSIHTVIQEDRFWEIIDELKESGAQGILVIPIEKMIL
jgi:ATP phosphoribosyltransferase